MWVNWMFNKLILCVFGLGFSLCSFAVQIDRLYQSSVPVTSQLPEERAEAFAQAMRHVLLKVSGDKLTLENEAIRQEIRAAEKYVMQFGYVAANTVEFPYRLEVSFIEKPIQTLLSANGLPVWGGNRPSVLFWLAIEADGARNVISSGSDAELVATIEKASTYRGLPLYLPVMDIEDSSALSVSDLWGLFMDPLIKASARYKPDAVAAMQLYQSALGEWKGRWTLSIGDNAFSSPVQAANRQAAVSQAVDDIASILASQYAVFNQSAAIEDRFDIEVNNVNSYADYVDLYRYVEALSPVVSSQVVWVREDKVRISIQMSGNFAKFEQHVSLDSKLKPEISNVSVPGDSFKLYYRWQD